jgi:hypothetical protein
MNTYLRKATNASIVVEFWLQTFRKTRMTCRTLHSLKPCRFPNVLILTLGIVLSSRFAVQSSRSLKTSRRKIASNEASGVKKDVPQLSSVSCTYSVHFVPSSPPGFFRARWLFCSVVWNIARSSEGPRHSPSDSGTSSVNYSAYAFYSARVTYIVIFVAAGSPTQVLWTAAHCVRNGDVHFVGILKW